MGAAPGASCIFIGLGEGRIDMDRTKDLVQTQPVFHGQHKLGEQVTRLCSHDRNTENAILARHC